MTKGTAIVETSMTHASSETATGGAMTGVAMIGATGATVS